MALYKGFQERFTSFQEKVQTGVMQVKEGLGEVVDLVCDRTGKVIGYTLLAGGISMAAATQEAYAQDDGKQYIARDGEGLVLGKNPGKTELGLSVGMPFASTKVKGSGPAETLPGFSVNLDYRRSITSLPLFILFTLGYDTYKTEGFDPNSRNTNPQDLYGRGFESNGARVELGLGFNSPLLITSGIPRRTDFGVTVGYMSGKGNVSGYNNPDILDTQLGAGTRGSSYNNFLMSGFGGINAPLGKIGSAIISARLGLRASLIRQDGSNNFTLHGVSSTNTTTFPDARVSQYATTVSPEFGINFALGNPENSTNRAPHRLFSAVVKTDKGIILGQSEDEIKKAQELQAKNDSLQTELDEIKNNTERAQEVLAASNDPRLSAIAQTYASSFSIYSGLRAVDRSLTLEELKNQGKISVAVYDQFIKQRDEEVKDNKEIIDSITEDNDANKKIKQAINTFNEKLKELK